VTHSANYSIHTQQQAGVRVSGHWTGVAVLISLRLWHCVVRRAHWAFLHAQFSPPLVQVPSPSPHPRPRPSRIKTAVPRLPMRCMIGLLQGTWGRGSHGRCARQATSIRRRRRRCGMWAAHARDVHSWTILYDIWPHDIVHSTNPRSISRYRVIDMITKIVSFHLNAACLFYQKTQNIVKNITWSKLSHNHPSLSKQSTGCTRQDLGMEHNILLSVTHALY